MQRSGRDRAYTFLRESILTDPQMQGQFVSEQDVADRVGVSRTPIREALLMLAAEDLVRLVPKKGAYIAPVSGREVAELMELRGMIERYAAERALAVGNAPVAEMKELIDRQRQLRSPDSACEFIDVDRLFHTALVACVGNGLLTKFYDGLRARQIRAGVVALYRSTGRQDAVLAEHEAIVRALAAGDAPGVATAITDHLQATLAVLLAA
ncbi:MAG TPA: GntR family transcriptional regulator [Pseudonocardia sp.]|jgi:DNA-binding GntR family transcriptional regulator|nr:GntR family transcriptional regulator [Pseudonocardia sp.]